MLDIFLQILSTLCARWVKLFEKASTISRDCNVQTTRKRKVKFAVLQSDPRIRCWTWSAVTAVGPPPPGLEVELGLQWLQSDPSLQDQKLKFAYVAFSRVQDPLALAVCLNNPDGFMRNIVFREVLWILTWHICFVQNPEISVPHDILCEARVAH